MSYLGLVLPVGRYIQGQKLPKTTVINIIAGQGEDTGIDEDTTFDEEDF